jgi:hypothetical protein
MIVAPRRGDVPMATVTFDRVTERFGDFVAVTRPRSGAESGCHTHWPFARSAS